MKTLKYLVIAAVVLFIAFLALPFPSIFLGSKADFPKAEIVDFVPNDQNNGEKCLAKTVYYYEPNSFTERGEGVANPFCARIQGELITAIDSGNIEEVKSLLAQGANANSPNNDYDLDSPIVKSVRKGNAEIVNLILANGANVDHFYYCCVSSISILGIAVQNDDLQTSRLLLSRGATLKFDCIFNGCNVFDIVSESENFEMFELIDNACKFNMLNRAELRIKKFTFWNRISRYFYPPL